MTAPRTLPRVLSARARGAEISRVASRFTRRARDGASGRHWYAETRAWAAEVVGPEGAPLFLRMLAATSPRASIKGNLRAAVRAYHLAAEGLPTSWGAPYGVPVNAIAVAAVAEGRAVRGQKVGPFAAALTGDSDAVAVDVWVARAAGYRDSPTAREVSIVTDAVRRVARALLWTAAEVQAAVWISERRGAGRTLSETYAEAYATL